jgi:hypothetical protein
VYRGIQLFDPLVRLMLSDATCCTRCWEGRFESVSCPRRTCSRRADDEFVCHKANSRNLARVW